MSDYKTAILAGGCFWGMQDLIRKQPGVVSTRVGYTGGQNANATYRNHPGHAEAIEIVYDPAQTDFRNAAGVLLPDPRPDHQGPAGQRRRHQLPVGDLLRRRRAEARRARHDRRRRRVGAVAGQGGHRSDTGRATSGRPSPSTRTIWSATPTGTRATSRGRAGSCRSGGPAVVAQESAAGWPATHHDAAAVLRRVRDAPEVDLLVRGVVGLDHEVPQHRSQDHVHLDVGERGADTAPGSAAERHPRRRCPGADEAVRDRSARDPGSPRRWRARCRWRSSRCSRAESATRRDRSAAPATWRPAKSITVRLRCSSWIVAWRNSLPPSSFSSTSLASTSGCRRSRSNAQPSVDAVVSWPGAEQRQQLVGDVLARHRRAVLVGAAQQQRQDVVALFELRVGFGLVDQRRRRCGRSCGGIPRAGPTGCSARCGTAAPAGWPSASPAWPTAG